jgi:hypothetical protein
VDKTFVTETDFWTRLEYRVSREFESMNGRRFLWCDGFVPQEYLVDDAEPRIEGMVWIGNGRRHDQWVFELMLGHHTRSLEDVPWAALLPSDSETGWLVVDVDLRHVRIVPSNPRAV